MKRRIALAGNPNSGKTSLFNELTGANQYVGNWPGVTVERKTGHLKEHEDIELLDLPGIYSLSPYSPEEVVTRKYLLDEKPDLVVDVVDATNLERNLYLTSQLMETGLPVVVALNMIDLAEQKGQKIDAQALSRHLGCPVVKVSALHHIGLVDLIDLLMEPPTAAPTPLQFSEVVEEAISALRIKYSCSRLAAVKMLENDPRALEGLEVVDLHFIEEKRLKLEQELGDDIASIIASGRYDAICSFMAEVRGAGVVQGNFSEKLDRVLTHRVWGLGIFVLVMWAIYSISIGTVGAWGTDWANDVLFGPVVGGWLAGFIGTEPAGTEALTMFAAVLAMCLAFPVTLRRLHDIGLNGSWLYLAIAPFLLEYMCPHLPEILHSIIMGALYVANGFMLLACLCFHGTAHANRYGSVPRRVGFRPLKLDGRAGRVEYLLWLVALSVISVGVALLGRVGLDCSVQLSSLVSDGIVAGVGAVLGFLPQMAVLFLLLSLLEDCGYMARVAFMMDRIFRSIGLSGKSFIPLLVSMGCGVPGVMATRTIENEKDRRMTIMLTTFVPCGAKLPIIALIGAVVGQNATIATIAYFAGIASVILGGLILRKTHMFAGGYTPFVMELPAYHTPRGTNINLRAMERCKAFVRKAGTIIFLASAIIWFASNYTWNLKFLNTAEDEAAVEQSMLADVGHQFAPIFSPLGWGDWRPAVATVTGLVAKENVVGTFGVLYAGSGEKAEEASAEAQVSETAETNEEEGELPVSATLPKCNAMSALTMLLLQADPQVRAAVPVERVDEEVPESAGESGEEAQAWYMCALSWLFGVEEDEEATGVAAEIQTAGAFTSLSALSFMLFNLLCAPCFAACGAIRREMNSGIWTWFAIGYMCAWAYVVALLVYQFGTWVSTGIFSTGQMVACVLAIFILSLLLRRRASAVSDK